MKQEFIYLLTYFIIYSFLGWVMESIFRTFCEKKMKINELASLDNIQSVAYAYGLEYNNDNIRVIEE